MKNVSLLCLSAALVAMSFEPEKSWRLWLVQILVLAALALHWPYKFGHRKTSMLIAGIAAAFIVTSAVTAFIVLRG